ncbi:MAG: reverse transcriptase domain-containing protein [Burkholderiaceae bacterium]
MGNLQTPPSVQKLQSALHAKAKGEPGYRFYLLYDKVYRADVLDHAYRCCRANKGAAGVDGQRFEDIESYGVERWLGELAQRLRDKTYEPAVRRVRIPKPNSEQKRPLGIPTITDRVVQMAMLLVLDPIFESDLAPEQFGYRKDRGAHDAVRAVHGLLNTGHTQVIDADLSGYFGQYSARGADAMRGPSRGRSAGAAPAQGLLVAPVEDNDGTGHPRRTRENRDKQRGTPQGAPISPLMSNLHETIRSGWKRLGFERRWSAKVVVYADDFVILCKQGADEAFDAMRWMMQRLKLTVERGQDARVRIPQGKRSTNQGL